MIMSGASGLADVSQRSHDPQPTPRTNIDDRLDGWTCYRSQSMENGSRAARSMGDAIVTTPPKRG
jgi:hypothetical protein